MRWVALLRPCRISLSVSEMSRSLATPCMMRRPEPSGICARDRAGGADSDGGGSDGDALGAGTFGGGCDCEALGAGTFGGVGDSVAFATWTRGMLLRKLYTV